MISNLILIVCLSSFSGKKPIYIEIKTLNCQNKEVLYSSFHINDTVNDVYYFKYSNYDEGIIHVSRKALIKSTGQCKITAFGYNSLCLKILEEDIETKNQIIVKLSNRKEKESCQIEYRIKCQK
jgi:hypothetical protein